MDIAEIRAKYFNGEYTCYMKIPTKVAADHVFDEELSIKRNRELVDEHNEKVELMKKEHRTKQLELDKQLTKDVVDYIVDHYELSREQARIVERFTYVEKHSCMSDYFSGIDTFADFADDLINWSGDSDERL
jgi:hypothetical protein